MKKASDLGLTSVDVPEEYGGSDMDKVSSAIIADRTSKSASFSVTWGAHAGIGTLPIVYFGTDEQKRKYLPQAGQRRMDRRLCALREFQSAPMP